MKGYVLFYDRKKGWGFIADPNTDAEYFVHRTAVVGKNCLFEDQLVEYEVGNHNGRQVAVDVRVIADAPAVREVSNAKSL